MTRCLSGFTPSCHLLSVPDSMSSLKMTVAGGGVGVGAGDLSGAPTVTDAVSARPLADARTLAVPARDAVTRPLLFTLTTAVSRLAHVMLMLLITRPFASNALATS